MFLRHPNSRPEHQLFQGAGASVPLLRENCSFADSLPPTKTLARKESSIEPGKTSRKDHEPAGSGFCSHPAITIQGLET